MKNLFKSVSEHFSSWEIPVDAVGHLTIAKKRLNKLCKLEKTITSKTYVSEKELNRIKEDQLESEKQLKRYIFYQENTKTKKIKGKVKMKVTPELKDIMRYAKNTELNYVDYIGAEPEYFPELEK